MEQYVGLDVSLKLTAICIVEGCDTIIVADDCLAVDDARPAA